MEEDIFKDTVIIIFTVGLHALTQEANHFAYS